MDLNNGRIVSYWGLIRRFLKQKNIVDDYAYKTVLSKSLVGFSEQMSSYQDGGEAQQLYISKVLSQILVDPQSKKLKKDTSSDTNTDIKETLSSLKDLPKALDKLSKTVADKEL